MYIAFLAAPSILFLYLAVRAFYVFDSLFLEKVLHEYLSHVDRYAIIRPSCEHRVKADIRTKCFSAAEGAKVNLDALGLEGLI